MVKVIKLQNHYNPLNVDQETYTLILNFGCFYKERMFLS